jgi:RNA polymerase sigma-70 factor (ECF subfamily)
VSIVDEQTFAQQAEQYRGELRVHCYRMLGSLDDAEDLVQETFLRAWRHRSTYEGRASLRAWLYRIATNACLDAVNRKPRRVLPDQLRPASSVDEYLPPTELPWLQPCPDALLEPGEVAVQRETIELAFLAAIQYLPPKQRAVLILRDVLAFSAKECAVQLDLSVASANSALQRARATLRDKLPPRRADWPRLTGPTQEERALLERYMAAHKAADANAVAALLASDVRAIMPPYPMWHSGRDTVAAALAISFDPTSPSYVGEFRMIPAAANRQPSVATYVRAAGDTEFRAFGIGLLTFEDGLVTEIAAFGPELFPAFDLPLRLERTS